MKLDQIILISIIIILVFITSGCVGDEPNTEGNKNESERPEEVEQNLSTFSKFIEKTENSKVEVDISWDADIEKPYPEHSYSNPYDPWDYEENFEIIKEGKLSKASLMGRIAYVIDNLKVWNCEPEPCEVIKGSSIHLSPYYFLKRAKNNEGIKIETGNSKKVLGRECKVFRIKTNDTYEFKELFTEASFSDYKGFDGLGSANMSICLDKKSGFPLEITKNITTFWDNEKKKRLYHEFLKAKSIERTEKDIQPPVNFTYTDLSAYEKIQLTLIVLNSPTESLNLAVFEYDVEKEKRKEKLFEEEFSVPQEVGTREIETKEISETDLCSYSEKFTQIKLCFGKDCKVTCCDPRVC